MKRILAPILTVALLAAIIAVVVLSAARRQGYITVLAGNTAREPVELVPGRYQDTQCGMLIEELRDAAQAVAPDGRTWFFDDVGCLALWLHTNPIADQMKLWAFARDTSAWIDARTAWYSRDSETVMAYGFAAHAARREGFVSFDEMQRLMLRGENLTDPYVRKELLGND